MLIHGLLRDQTGVSAIEYCLVAALIALGMVTSAVRVGATVTGALDEAGSALGLAPGKAADATSSENGTDNGNGNNSGSGSDSDSDSDKSKEKDKDKGKKPPK